MDLQGPNYFFNKDLYFVVIGLKPPFIILCITCINPLNKESSEYIIDCLDTLIMIHYLQLLCIKRKKNRKNLITIP